MNILETLSEKELNNIKLIKLKKDEILFMEDDVCNSVGIVKKGELKIVSYLENGTEVIYNVLSKSNIFGNNLIFSSEPIYRGDVVAKEETEVYLVDKATLVSILIDNEKFLLAYLQAQSDFGKQMNLNIKLLTFNNAKDRILYYLDINKNKIAFKSVADLANKLFLTREATSRELHKLEKDKIIVISAHRITKL